MKNLVVVIAIVCVFTAALSTAATCLILRDMAAASKVAKEARPECVDSTTQESNIVTKACPFPEQKIEVWPAGKGWILIKCLCPRQGAK